MTIALACLLTLAVLYYILSVRPKDLPQPEPVSPFDHLDERKAAIYENLRDLQFEYRLGKLSDQDYQATKRDLQSELARVLAEVDELKAKLAASPGQAPAAPPKPKAAGFTCPSCGANFAQELKFCGECGNPMKVSPA